MLAANALNDIYEVTAGRALNVDGYLTGYAGGQLQEISAFTAPGSVSQIEYSAEYGVLALRNNGTALHLIDAATRLPLETRMATWTFTDIDLSPDGRYLFAADYGGESYGSAPPGKPHYVHRLDLATRSWEVKTAPDVAYRLEAISGQQVLLQEGDQWIDVTLNDFGPGATSPMVELSRVRAGYAGDLEYDHRNGFAYHGGSGQINVRPVRDGNVILGIDTESHGSASGFGETVALAADSERLYYGRLQVEAHDVTNNLLVFPEVIYAATSRWAFGEDGYYDTNSGTLRGTLGFSSQVYFVSGDGLDIWAFDDVGDVLHHYRPTDFRSGVMFNDVGAGFFQAELASAPERGDITFRDDGSFTYVPAPGFAGIDRFTYITRASDGSEDIAEVTIKVQTPAAPPRPVNDDYTIDADEPLVVDRSVSSDLPELVRVTDFRAGGNVRKFVYAAEAQLLLLMNDYGVRVIDIRTETELSAHDPVHQFTDIDLSPDGRYLFAADYGGAPLGAGQLARPHFVHRLDLTTFTWETKQVPWIVWRIEAVDDHRFMVNEGGTSYATLNNFGDDAEESIVQLSRQYAGYSGEFEFDSHTGRSFHGEYSSQTIYALQLVGNALVPAENTGYLNSSLGRGGSVVLSSDRSAVYSGALRVDSSDVRRDHIRFPETILAASSEMAFGSRAWYDAETGKARGGWGFGPALVVVSDDGTQVWAFDPDNDRLHHYRIVPATTATLMATLLQQHWPSRLCMVTSFWSAMVPSPTCRTLVSVVSTPLFTLQRMPQADSRRPLSRSRWRLLRLTMWLREPLQTATTPYLDNRWSLEFRNGELSQRMPSSQSIPRATYCKLNTHPVLS